MSRSPNVGRLFSYFQTYLDRGNFPDNRGMLFQPVALVTAFEMFVAAFRKFEKEDLDKRMKNVK